MPLSGRTDAEAASLAPLASPLPPAAAVDGQTMAPLVALLYPAGAQRLSHETLPAFMAAVVQCPPILQAEAFELLLRVSRADVCNVNTLCRFGAMDGLIALFTVASDVVATKLVQLIQTVGAHSINAKELRVILSAMKPGGTLHQQPRAALLLAALQVMAEREGPAVFFAFSGSLTNPSGLTLPPMKKWSAQVGFTFSTWLKLDRLGVTERIGDKLAEPVLYSFFTSKHQGYSARFVGQLLVVEAHDGAVVLAHHPCSFPFRVGEWYMLTIVHQHNMLRKSEVRCYVNGVEVSSGPFKLVSLTQPFLKSHIGGSETFAAHTLFKGQMGAIYLFQKALTAETVRAIYRLGPSYRNNFQYDTECGLGLTTADRKALYEQGLSAAVMANFNARACEGAFCLETSPSTNASMFSHAPHATRLPGTVPMRTQLLLEAIKSLGGLQIFLPLLSHSSTAVTTPLSWLFTSSFFSLFSTLLGLSPAFKEELQRAGGFLILGHLLEELDPVHFSRAAVDHLLSLRTVLATGLPLSASPLLQDYFVHVVFNGAIWCRASDKVQISVYTKLAVEIVGPAPADFRQLIGVRAILHTLRAYYTDAASNKSAAAVEIRRLLVSMVRTMVTTPPLPAVQRDELEAIFFFAVQIAADDGADATLLQLLLALVYEYPVATVATLLELDAGNVFAALLISPSEVVRMCALRLIGGLLHFGPRFAERAPLLLPRLFANVSQKLRLTHLGVRTYRVLVELLLDNVQLEQWGASAESSCDLQQCTVVQPLVMTVLLELLGAGSRSVTDASSAVLSGLDDLNLPATELFLNDLLALIAAKHNRDALASVREQVYRGVLILWHRAFLGRDATPPLPSAARWGELCAACHGFVGLILEHSVIEERDGWQTWASLIALLEPVFPAPRGHTQEMTGFIFTAPTFPRIYHGVLTRLLAAGASAMIGSRAVVATAAAETAMVSLNLLHVLLLSTDHVLAVMDGHAAFAHQLAVLGRSFMPMHSTAESPLQQSLQSLRERGRSSSLSMMRRQRTHEPSLAFQPVASAGEATSPPRVYPPFVSAAAPVDVAEDTDANAPASALRRNTEPAAYLSALAAGSLHSASPLPVSSAPLPPQTSSDVPRMSEWVDVVDQLIDLFEVLLFRRLPLADIADVERVHKRPSGWLLQQCARLLIVRLSYACSIHPLAVVDAAPRPRHSPAFDHLTLRRVVNMARTLGMFQDARVDVLVSLFSQSALVLISLFEASLTGMTAAAGELMSPSRPKSPPPRAASPPATATAGNFGRSRSFESPAGKSANSVNRENVFFTGAVMSPADPTLLGTSPPTPDAIAQVLAKRRALQLHRVHPAPVQVPSPDTDADSATPGSFRDRTSNIASPGPFSVEPTTAAAPASPASPLLGAVGPVAVAPWEGDALQAREREASVHALVDLLRTVAFHAPMSPGVQRQFLSLSGKPLLSAGNSGLRAALDGSLFAMHLASQQWHFALSNVGLPRVMTLLAEGLEFCEEQTLERARQRGSLQDSWRRSSKQWASTGSAAKFGGGNLSSGSLAALRAEITSSSAGLGALTAALDEKVGVAAAIALRHNRVKAQLSWRALLEFVTCECGVWSAHGQVGEYFQLDAMLDRQLCRRRLIVNPAGSNRPDATCDSVVAQRTSRDADFATAGIIAAAAEESLQERIARQIELNLQQLPPDGSDRASVTSTASGSTIPRSASVASALPMLEGFSSVAEDGSGGAAGVSSPSPSSNPRRSHRRRRSSIQGHVAVESLLSAAELEVVEIATSGPVNDDGTTKIATMVESDTSIFVSAGAGATIVAASTHAALSGVAVPLLTDAAIDMSLGLRAGDASGLRDTVLARIPCHVVQPMRVVAGQFFITARGLAFEVDEQCELYVSSSPSSKLALDALNGKWAPGEIVGAFARRYLLRWCALELFFDSRTSLFVAFSDAATLKRVLRHVHVGHPGHGFIFDLAPNLRTSRFYPSILARSEMTLKWQNRLVSNFEYLMFLNMAAGRTLHDLAQHPVFPWILADYTSDTLDLSNPAVFRDLSKPIGALNATRLAQFQARYDNWDEDVMEAPPFHYGTHYSTPGFVLFWLIRMEPFTSYFLELQGGKFDHPDRTFFSVAEAWKNCQESPGDVKELIPEMFYLPEMFVNSNKFNFGSIGDNLVNDVVLPPWAKGSAEEFCRLHLAALESEHVSLRLHLWIDLIFGVKQRGDAAAAACNTFPHPTYEGGVDFASIDDARTRRALEEQIKNFGQTPTQLFLGPHPARYSVATGSLSAPGSAAASHSSSPVFFNFPAGAFPTSSPVASPKAIHARPKMFIGAALGAAASVATSSNLAAPGLDKRRVAAASPLATTTTTVNTGFAPISPDGVVDTPAAAAASAAASPPTITLSPSWQIVSATPRVPVVWLSANADTVVSVSLDQVCATYRWHDDARLLAPIVGATSDGPDHARRRLGEPFDTEVTPSSACFAASLDLRFVAATGFCDNSVKCFALVDGAVRPVRTTFSHDTVGTCVALSPTSQFFVTGSQGATVHVWPCPTTPFCADGRGRYTPIVGHEQAITSVAIDETQDLVVSASAQLCLLHTIRGKFLRRLVPVASSDTTTRLSSVALLSNSRVVTLAGGSMVSDLALYSVNGARIAAQSLPGPTLTALVVHEKAGLVCVGGAGRLIHVHRLADLSLLHTLPPCPAAIRTLAWSASASVGPGTVVGTNGSGVGSSASDRPSSAVGGAASLSGPAGPYSGRPLGAHNAEPQALLVGLASGDVLVVPASAIVLGTAL